MKNKFYTVNQSAPGVYSVVDTSNGATVNRFHLPGVLRSGPIVSNDMCTITTLNTDTPINYVVALPSGKVLKRYFVS